MFAPGIAALLLTWCFSAVTDWSSIAIPGASTAQAAPRKSASTSRAKRPKRTRVVTPSIVLPDDPAIPMRTSWERHLQEFLKRTGATYGAFVALEPETGVILALAEYSRNPRQVPHPALDSRFPAASIFKMVSAAAFLDFAGLRPDLRVCYHGGSSFLVARHLQDSPSRDRTCRSLASAFALSTNAVFGKLAVKYLDADRLLAFADRLGFNRRIEIEGKSTNSLARKARDTLDVGRMAAGFTNAWLSPLHAAVLGAVVANGGLWPTKAQIEGEKGESHRRVMSSETASALRAMMELAASSGTGRRYLASIGSRGGRGNAAVKTGTLSSRDGSGLFNTWMVGFYPARAPEFAFAALISGPRGGPFRAGHLTRYALETYIRLKNTRAGRS